MSGIPDAYTPFQQRHTSKNHGYSTQLFLQCQARQAAWHLFFAPPGFRHIFSARLHRMIGSHIARGGENMVQDIDELIFGDEEYTVSQR